MKTFKEKKGEDFDKKQWIKHLSFVVGEIPKECWEMLFVLIQQKENQTIAEATKIETERIVKIIKEHQAEMKEEEGIADFIYGHKKKKYLFKDLFKKIK